MRNEKTPTRNGHKRAGGVGAWEEIDPYLDARPILWKVPPGIGGQHDGHGAGEVGRNLQQVSALLQTFIDQVVLLAELLHVKRG